MLLVIDGTILFLSKNKVLNMCDIVTLSFIVLTLLTHYCVIVFVL